MPARKKGKTKQPLYKSRIAKLNKIGITSLSSTRKQSRKTQARVNRLWKQYSEVANNPEKYTTRKVNKERAKLLTDLDYVVHKDKAFFYKEGFKNVSLRYEKVNGKKRTVLTRTTPGGKKYKALIIPPGEIHDELEQFDKKRLPKGEFITVQIGNRSPFSTRFKSVKQLQYYIDNKFSPQQPLKKSKQRGKRAQEKLRQELISQMSIVKF